VITVLRSCYRFVSLLMVYQYNTLDSMIVLYCIDMTLYTIQRRLKS